VRLSVGSDFRSDWPVIEDAIDRGVGGFLLYGGEAGSVRDLTAEIRARSPHPLLIASDLERGAGQQFVGATQLPPASALAALNDPEVTRRAGEMTAREARAIGVEWILAPVADIDLEPENPIVGTRAFGVDARSVAVQVAAWIRGCREGGGLSCAKHFPGHGRTRGDSHVELPVVHATRLEMDTDLLPFRSAITAGADSVMVGHVAYPSLEPVRRPATLSPPLLRDLLRGTLGFQGVAVSDAADMAGFRGGGDARQAITEAILAGCDVILSPPDLESAVGGLADEVRRNPSFQRRVEEASRRIDVLVERIRARPVERSAAGEWGIDEDREWAQRIALRTLSVIRGAPNLPPAAVSLVEVDDDLDSLRPAPSRAPLRAALRRARVELAPDGRPLLVVFADVRAGKGRRGLSHAARERVRTTCEAAPETTVILFGHPGMAAELPFARHILLAWGGEALMQRAVAARLASSGTR